MGGLNNKRDKLMKNFIWKNLFVLTLISASSQAFANHCVEEFEEHSKFADDIQKYYKICENKNLTYSNWSINGIQWGDYFTCFTRLQTHQKEVPFFFRKCLNKKYSEYISSYSFSECQNEMKKNHPKKDTSICLDERIGTGVSKWGFSDCMEDAAPLGLKYSERLNLCIGHIGDKKISCAKDILSLHKVGEALKICDNYQARKNIDKKNYLPCMKALMDYGISKESATITCSKRDFNSSIECINNNNGKFSKDTLASYCSEQDFRDASENRSFHPCVQKAQKDNLSLRESISVCTQDDDLIELFAKSEEFASCKETVKNSYGFSTKSAYSSCSDQDVRSQIGNDSFMSCFENGIKSGLLGYFEYRTDELENSFTFNLFNKKNNNPYYYVIENCFDDQSFSRYKKENKYLKLFADYNIHSNTVFKKERTLLGGLSALRFDQENSKLYFLSDDKGHYGEPRIYVYDYSFESQEIKLFEDKLIKFKKPATIPMKGEQKTTKQQSFSWGMDPEGMDFGSNGEIIISSEVDDLSSGNGITVFSPEGVKISNLDIGKDFVKEGFDHGMQHNKGFESLSISPSKNSLFVANESTLSQDKKYTWKDGNCRWRDCINFTGEAIRIAKYSKEGTTYKEKDQYFYVLDNEVDNGVSEVLALDENNLLVLERSWDNSRRKITAKIFHVNLKSAQPIPSDLGVEEEKEKEEEKEEEVENEQENSVTIVPLKGEDNDNDENDVEIDPYYFQEGDRYFHDGNIYRRDFKYGPYNPTDTVQPVSRRNATRTNYKQKRRKEAKAEVIENFTLKKKLILDMDDIVSELSPGFRRLDNFEGLALGPILPNGNPSLALVGDNNFSLNQRSLFILLEMKPRVWHRLLRN
tara:strand:+ start:29065 stop:31668 length:2604 start_codon:yes stop_codon:yes gene_type:complete